MKTRVETRDRKVHHLIGGSLYLMVIFCGLFSEMAVRGSLFTPEQLGSTLMNWESSLHFLSLGIASDLIMVLADIGLAWVFWLLLNKDFPKLALLAAFFRLVQAAMIGSNLTNLLQILVIPEELIAPETILGWVEAHRLGYLLTGIPFGMSCILLGYMMVKSSWFSKILGWMVTVAGIAYITDSFTQLVFPAYAPLTETLILSTAVITELTLCIYLLWKGIKKEKIN